MAKTTKTAATSATPVASASASASAATPVKVVKAAKAPKEPAAAAAAAPVVVAATAPVVSDAGEESVAPSTDSVISSQFASISAKLQQVVAFAASLRSELRSLERHAVKELRTAQKASAKKRRKVGNRAPSGFVKPTPISKELAEFLGKTDGSRWPEPRSLARSTPTSAPTRCRTRRTAAASTPMPSSSLCLS